MALTHAQLSSLKSIERGLDAIGYPTHFRQRDYAFADFFGSDLTTRTADLAAFAREPFSYDTACIAVACANGAAGADLVERLRALGAPMVFEVGTDGGLTRWRMTASGPPLPIEPIPSRAIARAMEHHRQDWSPDALLRAKAIPRGPTARQLDFFDIGLMPAIGEAVSAKFHGLLERVIGSAKSVYAAQHSGKEPDYAGLFRLVFRLIAAKVLGDRGHPGRWLAADARDVLQAIEAFYFATGVFPPALSDPAIQQLVWDGIRKGFHFQNVSVDALAYTYESTLITTETRKAFGVHSTPPGIAEYLVRHLPFGDMPLDELRVLEPCAGHAVFLVAAMRRMRELLPMNMTAGARHRYFVERLAGIEVDPFAREVARLSLMLADYPNPDGWRIIGDDVFSGAAMSREARRAAIVLCNPPFEDFSRSDRERYGDAIQLVQKPAELLRRILSAGTPAQVGFVLPRTFISGRAYKRFHRAIGERYTRVEIVALPDGIFTHSDAESAILLAHTPRTHDVDETEVRCSLVTEADRNLFLTSGQVSQSHIGNWADGRPSLWTPPLQDIWRALSQLPTLGSAAEIHRGIQYRLPLDEANRPNLISDAQKAGFVRGLDTAQRWFSEAFICKGNVWLNVSPSVLGNKAHLFPWHDPKVIVNAATVSRGPWRLISVPDDTGLACYQDFHGVWPKPEWNAEALAAVLNGPVANAYVRDHEGKRHNKIVTLKAIPVPCLAAADLERLTGLVREYLEARALLDNLMHDNTPCAQLRRILQQIDAIVLRGYDLPPRLERRLLDQFNGHRRPVPFDFMEFFPRDFLPCIPYHEYISLDFQRASASETLKRLHPIRDAEIHEAMEHLRRLDED
jgi:hypothetical protein